jgi:peptide/nickel transport system substrate-binding protein
LSKVRKRIHLACVALVIAVAALVVAGCGSGGGTSASTTNTKNASLSIKQTGIGLTEPTTGSGAKIKGGTVTWAEAPDSPPNYIFPMYSAEYCGNNNIFGIDNLLYRPLYWYGNNYSPKVDLSYSVGKAPQYSNGGKTVTVRLNHYMWSNGTPVTARDLVFWMNVLKADPAAEWCSYTPGKFPDNVTSYKAVNPTTFQLTFNKAYDHQWLQYEELAQLVPIPMAWDRTSLSQPVPNANASNLPDTTKAGALKVFKFLNGEATKLSTWGSSPLWSVVDGPWTVQSTTANGGVTFVPNKHYTGPIKPTIAKFVEVPFTSEQSLVDELKSQGTSSLTMAYIPSQDQPLSSQFKSEGYDVNMASTYGIYYFPLNLNAPTIGKVFQQLYFRQALQHLVDQEGWIKNFMHGDGVPTYGPVPSAPPSTLVSAKAETAMYGFSVPAAIKLLKTNGWHVVPNGTSTCAKPGTGAGECGAGITKGQPISFNVDYESDVQAVQQEMEDLQSQASKAGIKINLTSHPFDDVYSAAVHCSASQPGCKWDAENWGSGWFYDYYPSGENLYYSSSVSDQSNYASAKMNQVINKSLTASSGDEQAAMSAFARYTESQAPVVYMPEAVGDFASPVAGNLIDSKLGGFAANAYGGLNPEAWYLTK